MDNIKEEHFKLCAGNKAYLVIFNFYLGINRKEVTKELHCSPIIRVAGSYHPKNVLMTLCVGKQLFEGFTKCTSLQL